MKNIHRNIRNASLISLFLLLCIWDTYLDILSGHPRYELTDCYIICFILVVISFAIMYRSICWKRTKNIQAYLHSQGARTAAEEKLRLFLENAPEYHGVQYSPLFICGRDCLGLEFAEVKKIQGYCKTHRYARNFFIPVFKFNYLTLYMYDSKPNVTFCFWKEKEVDDVIQFLKHEYPFLTEYKAN